MHFYWASFAQTIMYICLPFVSASCVTDDVKIDHSKIISYICNDTAGNIIETTVTCLDREAGSGA